MSTLGGNNLYLALIQLVPLSPYIFLNYLPATVHFTLVLTGTVCHYRGMQARPEDSLQQ